MNKSVRENAMEEDGKREKVDSPTISQKTVSDDDEIDYSVEPEFYDPLLDDKDEIWVQKKRKGPNISDALLSCPACFTTLCLECQRHEKYLTQYRAIFVLNCKIGSGQVKVQARENLHGSKRKREYSDEKKEANSDAKLKPVCCSVCSTEVGVIDEDKVYHFFNVLPSES